jgi:hypothetical protein
LRYPSKDGTAELHDQMRRAPHQSPVTSMSKQRNSTSSVRALASKAIILPRNFAIAGLPTMSSSTAATLTPSSVQKANVAALSMRHVASSSARLNASMPGGPAFAWTEAQHANAILSSWRGALDPT